ncbi:MAG: hypothetical protein CMO26_00760 [Thiotrichales bacterium]|nr:hypothetical protein [Thiotrichales bacterium]
MTPSLGVLLYADYRLSELIELGRLSEQLGYQALWYTDVRFGRECYMGLAAIAGATRTLRLGPGVSDPYTRHPAMTASTIATLDELCDGRAQLGLGVGGQGFKELGLDRPLPVAALRETVEVVRSLLAGDTVTSTGKVISLTDGKLTFTPQRDAVPIYFATHGAQVSKLAGKLADGVLIANTLRPGMLDFYRDRINEGRQSSGRLESEFDFGLRIEACISDNYEAAFGVMRKRMAGRIIGQYPHWDYLNELGVTLPEAFVDTAKHRDESRAEQAAPHLPAEIVQATVLAGDPQRVAAQLAPVMDGDVGSITIRPHAPPGGTVQQVITAFANEVIPRVRALTGR